MVRWSDMKEVAEYARAEVVGEGGGEVSGGGWWEVSDCG